jgi:putative endonuclease
MLSGVWERGGMRTSRQRSGDWAEQRALRLLRCQGWRLLSRQWHCRWGELDLVLAKPGRVLLVEVKARGLGARPAEQRGVGVGTGGWALGAAKRRRLERAWHCWLADHPTWAEASVEWVAALVPLPPSRQGVRWVRLER